MKYFVLAAVALSLTGCAVHQREITKIPAGATKESATQDYYQCQFEATKNTPPTYTTSRNWGAAIANDASREGDLMDMCMHAKGYDWK